MIKKNEMNILHGILSVFAAVVILVACNGNSDSPEKPGTQTAERAAMDVPVEVGSLSGKIVETMDSGGYTYVLLERDGEKKWVAMPAMEVSVGQEIALMPGGEMINFTSKTLDRTFDMIIFSSGPVSERGAMDKKDMKMPPHDRDIPMSMMKAPESAGMRTGTPIKEDVHVEKASGPNAYTVAELYENKSVLNKQEIVLRGKVVKVLQGILGRNWVHLQDGSGDGEKGNHDIVVTSQELPSLGDVITANGTLITDKEFGTGYRYKVIVEDATIKK